MEDNQLKSLFSRFEPELSSDYQFMRKLERKINSVEMIQQNLSEARKRYKRAAVMAGIIGFIIGFLFSLSLPYLDRIVLDLQIMLPHDSVWNLFVDNFPIIFYLTVGCASITVAYNIYELELRHIKNSNRLRFTS